MTWELSWRCDPRARALADRHYNRQSVGAQDFVPPGRCFVLFDEAGAFWVTSWPFAEYVQHAWAGAWMCTAFRNESTQRASDMIRDAVAHTLWNWPNPPPLGMVTFIDPSKIRRSREPGRVYRLAGFSRVGVTGKGLLAYQLLPADMPPPREPQMAQMRLFTEARDA